MRIDPLVVLLVEDNMPDIRLTKMAIEYSELTITLEVVHDGIQALEYLEGLGAYAQKPKPDLMLLDLNMPRMNGLELIARLRSDSKWRALPILVLTSSSAPSDIESSYAAGANYYLIKPMNFDEYMNLVTTSLRFWGSMVELPGRTQ
jgi:two-component system, chemotaxis family, response regulator Rcp1